MEFQRCLYFYSTEEIGTIGHFNMGTFEACGIGTTVLEGVGPVVPPTHDLRGATVPPPSTFAPTTVDVDSWVKALASFGAARAVLVSVVLNSCMLIVMSHSDES